MNKKIVHINLSLLCALLFALLFQSVHSFHHIVAEFTTEKCHHEHSESKTQVTHQHHFEKCFSCEYRFSHFTATQTYFASHFTPNVATTITLFFPPSVKTYSGTSASLRGPPVVIA